jgi:hypothetical protein
MAAQFPTNPLDMRSFCTRYTASDGAAHIYLLRYQTPAELMTTITNLTQPVYAQLNNVYFGNNTLGLIGLGYFKLNYDGNGNMSAIVYDTDSIPNVIDSIGDGKPTLTTDQFIGAGQFPIFVDLVHALVYKAFLDLFIQSNMRYAVPFSCIISLDLYASRNPGQALLFHRDATTAFPTKFFTLTYIIEDPSIIVKGPTIVTAEELADRSAVIPAVRHGTTVGVDNTAVLHATPDPYVTIAAPGVAMEMRALIPPQNPAESAQFRLKTSRESADYEGDELASERIGREGQVAAIQQATSGTQRSFIRIWYNIAGFPEDPNPTSRPIPLNLKIEAVTFLVNNILDNTCFIETGTIVPPEIHIGSRVMQRVSLGGAEMETPGTLKPLQYEEKIKPSIEDVVTLPDFQKLVASTDNFIVGTFDKNATIPMGGKQVARSKKGKKKTLKRGKRSRTRRRMGGKKTYKKTKQTKQTKTKR